MPSTAVIRCLSPDMLHLDLKTRNHDFELQLSVVLPATGITAVYGHNGSGKTTLLRCIAGLQDCSGSIRLNDDRWLDTAANIHVPAHRRRIGYLFQDLRLFPHLDVAGNLAFARKRRPAPEEYVGQVVELLQITSLLARSTAQLSGGERQRVALARSLITRPDLLLLDEPTAALDPHARSEVLPFLHDISSTFAIPTLLVSHAIDEVAHMAEHTLVLQAGQVATYGPTPQVVASPAMHRLAGRSETGSLIHARTLQYDDEFQVATVSCHGQQLTLPLSKPLKMDTQVNLFIHARDVSLALSPPQQLSIRNILATELTSIEELAGTPFADVQLRIGEQSLVARLTRAAVHELQLQPGMACWALIKSASLDQPE